MSAARAGAAPARRGLLGRVLESWRAPGRVVAGLAGMPEGAMTALLMAALFLLLVAQAPAHARAAALDPSIPFAARMGGALLAVMFLMPLVLHGLAALVAAVSRWAPRRVAPADSRLALFWALLASAPASLLAGLVAGLAGPGLPLTALRALAFAAFLVIWGAGLRALARPR